MTVRVSGARELRRTLRAAGISAQDLRDAHAAAARVVLSAAHPPRRSGALAASQRPSAAATRARVSAGGARVPYAAVIHYGWAARGIRANPWLSRARDSTESRWVANYMSAIDAILETISN